MQLPAMAAWAWIPIVVSAALFQTIRNAAQRSLTAELGTLAATLVRFLFGLPFAIFWLLVVVQLLPADTTWPTFGSTYLAWLILGAVTQIAATSFLLLAMKERNFVVAVAFAKTEVLQVALFASVFLSEVPGLWAGVAMAVSTVGVLMLSVPKNAVSELAGSGAWLGRSAWFGLASGAGFALASVGYRGAALTLPGVSPWLIGAWGVVIAQLLQTALLGGWIAAHTPAVLPKIARAWKLSSVAGTMGALASIGWFTAFAMRPAVDVKTLSLIEVLFSYLVSRKLFDEHMSRAEKVGLTLITLGLVVISAQF
jgi:drug/metabolite transporter (DMT)-like permease